MKIAIVGNPNCGKTTLFNELTGANQKVGNWPGVTVDKITGSFTFENQQVELVDLPGIYSLSAFSEDEKIAVQYLLQGEYDLIINVVDASSLERSLFLTMQLRELGQPILVVANMKDLAVKRKIEIDDQVLGKSLNMQLEYVSAFSAKDISRLKKNILDFKATVPNSGEPRDQLGFVESEAELLSEVIPDDKFNDKTTRVSKAWVAQKTLEVEPFIDELFESNQWVDQTLIEEAQARLKNTLGVPVDVYQAQEMYKNIERILKHSLKKPDEEKSLSNTIDKLVLNKYLGFPIFLFVMYTIFWMTIHLGGAFIDFFDISVGTLFVDLPIHLLNYIGAPQFVISLLANGIGGGVQTLATFIPIIFVLFLMISVLETSGYMSRAAVVMDRLMRILGLPGKAFIPLLIGFGCTVPAIMATRTLDNRKDRVLTAFMAPFMSCGARMPVYALFAAAFFPNHGQNIVFLIYLIGMAIAAITGILLKNTVFKTQSVPFVMELPKYHVPRLKHVLFPAWNKVVGFLKKSSKILIPIITVLAILNSLGTDMTFGNEDTDQSVLAHIGKSITPALEPMGLKESNWPATVGLFTGLFAKEAIVGTLNALYMQSNNSAKEVEEFDDFSVISNLKDACVALGSNIMALSETLADPLGLQIGDSSNAEEQAESTGVELGVFQSMRQHFGEDEAGEDAAFAYLLFVLLYIPCIVAVSAAWKEIGAILSLIQVYYSTMLAWVLSTIYFQATSGGSNFWILISIAILVTSVWAILFYAKRSEVFTQGKLHPSR